MATREATSRLVAHLMEFGAGVHRYCVLARVGVVPAVAPPPIKKYEERTKKKVELMSCNTGVHFAPVARFTGRYLVQPCTYARVPG